MKRCFVCQRGKGKTINARKYSPLPTPKCPWINISIDFVVGLPRCLHGRDSIFVVVNRFTKIAHFIPCKVNYDVTMIANLFFKEIVCYHGLPSSITSNRDTRFMS